MDKKLEFETPYAEITHWLQQEGIVVLCVGDKPAYAIIKFDKVIPAEDAPGGIDAEAAEQFIEAFIGDYEELAEDARRGRYEQATE